MTSSSAFRSAASVPLHEYHVPSSSKNTSSLISHGFTSSAPWQTKSVKDSIRLTLPAMSGFLSSDAEAALRGEEEALGIFYHNQQRSNQSQSAASGSGSSYPQHQQWAPVDYATMSYQQQVPPEYTAPSQYVSWPSASLPSLPPHEYPGVQYSSGATPVLSSTPYGMTSAWPNAPWPALHPDDVDTSSSTSRSVSPNPADLTNFGILLPDGKSWQCAHRGCTSQARFTRGCDLRKHYRRHTKSLFCRHEDCLQSKEGGFSSRKDRDRHESRHKPGVHCSFEGCDRVFSRVDNMKDHVRRIHEKKS